MKRLLLVSILGIAALVSSARGQGYIFFDSSTSPNGVISFSGVIDTATDVNAALVVVDGGTNRTIATLLLSDGTAAGDITFFGDGHLYDNSGLSYNTGLPAGPTTFIVEVWLSGNSYVSGGLGGESFPFVMTTAAFGSPVPSLDTMPTIVIMPEPSSFTLSVLGIVGLALQRRINRPKRCRVGAMR